MPKLSTVLNSRYPKRYFPIKKVFADYPVGSYYYRVSFFGTHAHSGSYEECYATRAGYIAGLKAFKHLYQLD